MMMKYYISFFTCVLILDFEQQFGVTPVLEAPVIAMVTFYVKKTITYSQSHGKRDVEKQM